MPCANWPNAPNCSRTADFGRKPPLILGSTRDRDLAKELRGFIVEVSFPASYEVVLSRSYAGYRGALGLIEMPGAAPWPRPAPGGIIITSRKSITYRHNFPRA